MGSHGIEATGRPINRACFVFYHKSPWGRVDVEDDQDVGSVEEARVVGAGLEPHVEECADEVVLPVPESWGFDETVEAFQELETGVATVYRSETSRDVSEDRSGKNSLHEGVGEVGAAGKPSLDDHNNQHDAHRGPLNDGRVGLCCVGASLEVASDTDPCLVLLDCSIGGSFDAEHPCERQNLVGGTGLGDLEPGALGL